MELRNKLSLEIEEAILILQNLANSLAEKGKFELQLENQEVSLEVGTTLSATLIFSDTRFSLDFQWSEKQKGIPSPQSKPQKQQMASVEVSSQSTPSLSESQILEQLSTLRTEGLKPRKFQPQMILETTTLPYEGGVWSPAFTLTETSIWTQMDINNQLENSKWISEEELEALTGDDLPRKPRVKMPGVSRGDDGDMFSGLDDEEPKRKTVKETMPVTQRSQREVVTPAGVVSPSSIPRVTLKKEELEKAAASWSEPAAEDNISADEWVKPSDVLHKKRTEATNRGIPSPKTGSGVRVSTWEEPESDDDDTGDAWVKPSEVLKQKNEGNAEKNTKSKEVNEKKNRPPPPPPDTDS